MTSCHRPSTRHGQASLWSLPGRDVALSSHGHPDTTSLFRLARQRRCLRVCWERQEADFLDLAYALFWMGSVSRPQDASLWSNPGTLLSSWDGQCPWGPHRGEHPSWQYWAQWNVTSPSYRSSQEAFHSFDAAVWEACTYRQSSRGRLAGQASNHC